MSFPPLSRSLIRARTWPLVVDAAVFGVVLAAIYAILTTVHYWMGVVTPAANISRSPRALPGYALYSLVRMTVAYLLSLVFAVAYGYVAAYHKRLETVMVALLDILQSIPVLSFLPGVMVSMVALFPSRQLGVELGCILLIFTGQVWNMTFSVYASLKNIPTEMLEAAQVYRLSWWQQFVQLELPYSAIGLVWNSMMSVAGGWFFLMACEMFVLGNRDLRLPGLGSYLQTAANAGDTRAILWGVATMIAVIVLMDQIVWRPIIAWSEKFKVELVEASQSPRSPVLDLLRRSKLLSRAARASVEPVLEAFAMRCAEAHESPRPQRRRVPWNWVARMLSAAALLGILYAVVKMGVMIAALSKPELRDIFRGAGATFLRVELVLVLAGLWTIPVGVYVGLRPRLSAIFQPIAQIAASVPATALFPIVLLLLIRLGGGLGIGSIVLLLLGTQWYILFNVIAGASAIPTDLKEVCGVFHLGGFERWRKLLLPAIFPYLVTGFVTASGGAWNASIVAEYFRFQGKIMTTLGLGAQISSATDSGNTLLLLLSTVVMAMLVVTVNRLVWKPLYRLAETRYRLEG
jgi:NitT/TauT family transport system permease protein